MVIELFNVAVMAECIFFQAGVSGVAAMPPWMGPFMAMVCMSSLLRN